MGKKGSSLFTINNVRTYPELRKATFRIINKIKSVDGFIFYSGIEKEQPNETHTPEALYTAILRDSIRRLDKYCRNNGATFSLLLDAIDSDEPGAKRKFRLSSINAASSEMFGLHHGYSCNSLLEPPYQLESHLYQNLQCADWICGLLNRYLTFIVESEEYPDYEIFSKYFSSRLEVALKAQSIKRKI